MTTICFAKVKIVLIISLERFLNLRPSPQLGKGDVTYILSTNPSLAASEH